MRRLCIKYCNIKTALSYNVKKESVFFMTAENLEKNQLLTLENRARFTVCLVENVESFSDNEIILKTGFGGLHIVGNALKLEDLSIDNGNIILTGKIDKIEFVDIKEKRSFFASMFR